MSTTDAAWTAVSVRFAKTIDEVGLDLASGELFELGAEGIEQRDGAEIEVIASFATEEGPETLAGLVQAALQRLGLPVVDITVTDWPDIDWSTHWRRHYKPLSFGRVWVVPRWLQAPPEAEVVLRIDPQMAFGTGLHPTTAMCMERVVALSPIDSLLDVGTGTGILSMGAAALGVGLCRATDVDGPSVEQAIKNAADNGLADRIQFICDGEVNVEGTYSVVVANILAEPLIRLADRIAAKVAPGGATRALRSSRRAGRLGRGRLCQRGTRARCSDGPWRVDQPRTDAGRVVSRVPAAGGARRHACRRWPGAARRSGPTRSGRSTVAARSGGAGDRRDRAVGTRSGGRRAAPPSFVCTSKRVRSSPHQPAPRSLSFKAWAKATSSTRSSGRRWNSAFASCSRS